MTKGDLTPPVIRATEPKRCHRLAENFLAPVVQSRDQRDGNAEPPLSLDKITPAASGKECEYASNGDPMPKRRRSLIDLVNRFPAAGHVSREG